MIENIIGLLPCAGTASRLHNLPKFMLPLKNTKGCLLTRWINLLLLNECNKIIIGASDYTKEFIKQVVDNDFGNVRDKIFIKLVGKTETMNETVIKCLENETFDFVIMGMPDTVVENISTKMIKNTEIDVGVNLWNIRETQLGKIGQCKIDDNYIIDIIDKNKECKYNYGWGVVVFKQPFMKYILKEDLHTGYSMQRFLSDNNKITYEIVNGLYFDCGTIDGYKEYLNYMECITPVHIKGTLIILAVYINNTENSYNVLISCLNQIREIYPNEFIVAVDNGSLNDKWYQVAKESNIIILKNTSTMHKYEIGAYKCALQYFRADKYICVQGTMFLKKKIDLSSLNKQTPNAIAFQTLNALCLSNDGLQLIDKLLNSIEMGPWNNEPYTILWNCFCCNNSFIKDMLESGVFDLPSHTKNHSCAFEKILGYYFNMKLKTIDIVNSNTYKKIFLDQDKLTM
tara:strand:- start:2462 stop:3832 length:1371 start_codon:yes stop_codon:yes gene_type:complete